MEFADLIHELLKENGISANIQPHWSTPSLWEKKEHEYIDFGPPATVRAVQANRPVNSSPYSVPSTRDRIIVAYYHPVMERVYLRFTRPRTKAEFKVRYRRRPFDRSELGSREVWEVFTLADPDALDKLVDRFKYLMLTGL